MTDTPSSTELGQYASRARERVLTEVQEEICRRIMEGDSVRAIASDEGMPSRSTVLNWLASDPTFRTAYGFAKQLQAEVLVEEAIEIADDASGDWVESDGGLIFDRDNVLRARLRVDTRKWAAGKLAPKRYGDASLLRIDDATREPREMNRAEMFARMASLSVALSKKGS